MSINQYSSEAYWWAQQQLVMDSSAKTSSSKQDSFISQPHHAITRTVCSKEKAFGFNLNEDDEDLDEQMDGRERQTREELQECDIPKEALFEKPLTPSDVGKLNRLVIPKQHAEKYFPLNGGDSGEKGFLLGFEDEVGKSWRFRYSYWNSSQSYVLTKGWSRFVKDKKLDAGDIVLFQRHRLDCTRLFIGWRRKNSAPPPTVAGGGGGFGGWTHFYSGYPFPSHQQGISLPYQPDCLHAGSAMQNQTTSSGNSKKLRLFGVNLECQADDSEIEPEPELSTSGWSPGLNRDQVHNPWHQNYPQSHTYSHMDINFSGDDHVYRQG